MARCKSLKDKTILITAGPTWVPVDKVRVISNISSGKLGLLLAREALKNGFKTDLFLGPVGDTAKIGSLRVSRFSYFNKFQSLVEKTLKKKKYDVIIHCAAVSDYICRPVAGKISSKKENLILSLKKAPKIINLMRKLNPKAFLVMFKLESGVRDTVLLKRASAALNKAGADLVVANSLEGQKYRAHILGLEGEVFSRASSREHVARALFAILKERVN